MNLSWIVSNISCCSDVGGVERCQSWIVGIVSQASVLLGLCLMKSILSTKSNFFTSEKFFLRCVCQASVTLVLSYRITKIGEVKFIGLKKKFFEVASYRYSVIKKSNLSIYLL